MCSIFLNCKPTFYFYQKFSFVSPDIQDEEAEFGLFFLRLRKVHSDEHNAIQLFSYAKIIFDKNRLYSI